MKVCLVCNVEQPLDHFGLRGKWRLARCKPCNKVWRRDYFLRHRFGISLEEYEAMFKRQDEKCAICRRSVEHTLHVDHCHKTERVRGLLCIPCNLWLGYMKDDVHLVEGVLEYLGQD